MMENINQKSVSIFEELGALQLRILTMARLNGIYNAETILRWGGKFRLILDFDGYHDGNPISVTHQYNAIEFKDENYVQKVSDSFHYFEQKAMEAIK